MQKENARRGFTQKTFYTGGKQLFTSPLEGEDVHRTEEGETQEQVYILQTGKEVGCSPLPQGRGGTACGFTLIELLVVVLIIGILAAVAVPQYQKAVYRSQYSKLKILAASIAQAQEVYYLANGQYATKFEELDIDMPGGKTDESTDITYVYDWGHCTIIDGEYAQVDCKNYKINMGYQHRQAHATVEPNARKCQSYSLEETDIRNQICKAETGAVSGTEMPSFTTTSWKYQ